MSSITFKVTVQDVPRKHLVGNWMSLNAAADQEDYEALWQVFSNRLNQVPGLVNETSYGICANLQENLDCNYWTAIENFPGMPVPRGMVAIAISDGPYACLSNSYRVTLDEAYDYLGNHWERSQATFVIDRQKPCFEQYDRQGGFKLYVPLKLRCSKHVRPELSAMASPAAA